MLETNETITFTLSNATGFYVSITDTYRTGTVSNDAAALTIADVCANENDGVITGTVTLDNAVQVQS